MVARLTCGYPPRAPEFAIEHIFLAVQFMNVKKFSALKPTRKQGLVVVHDNKKWTGIFMLGLDPGKLFGGLSIEQVR